MTLKAVMIGAGGVANTHMAAYRDNANRVEVVAVCDVVPGKAQSFADRYGIPRAYDSASRMLKENKADIASVVTPNSSHRELTLKALDAKCHVLCEKPIGMNAREARQMADAARKARRILTIGHHMRFEPEYMALRRMIEGGALGDIYYASIQGLRRRGIPAWGVFHIRKFSGGGALIDIGVHYLDLVLWLMGNPEPERLSAMTYDRIAKRDDLINNWGSVNREEFDTDDFVSGYIRCKGGITINMEVSWAANTQNSTSHKIFGTVGGAMTNPLRIFTQSSGTLVEVTPSELRRHEHSHTPVVQNLLDAIEKGTDIVVKPEQSIQVMRIIDAIYKSAKQGKEVLVTEV